MAILPKAWAQSCPDKPVRVVVPFAPGNTLDTALRQVAEVFKANTGQHLLGDRWTVAVILGAFLGLRRFDDWQTRLNIPRHTLTVRLKALIDLGLLQQRPYQQHPLRHAYRLTDKGIVLYSHVLMMWVWERRWGARRLALPQRLMHQTCGHAFVPELACTACGDKVGMGDLTFSLRVNPDLLAAMHAASHTVAPAVPALRGAGCTASPLPAATCLATSCAFQAGPAATTSGSLVPSCPRTRPAASHLCRRWCAAIAAPRFRADK